MNMIMQPCFIYGVYCCVVKKAAFFVLLINFQADVSAALNPLCIKFLHKQNAFIAFKFNKKSDDPLRSPPLSSCRVVSQNQNLRQEMSGQRRIHGDGIIPKVLVRGNNWTIHLNHDCFQTSWKNTQDRYIYIFFFGWVDFFFIFLAFLFLFCNILLEMEVL